MQTTSAATIETTTAERLRNAIETRTATFGVIGLGYVGLPLATAFAEAGFRTVGFDIETATVARLNAGDSHIRDVPAQTIAALVDAGRFEATTEMARLAEADIISICVPTPLSKPAIRIFPMCRRRPGGGGKLAARAAGHSGEYDLSRTTRRSSCRNLRPPADRRGGFLSRLFAGADRPGQSDLWDRQYPQGGGRPRTAFDRAGHALYRSAIEEVFPVSTRKRPRW